MKTLVLYVRAGRKHGLVCPTQSLPPERDGYDLCKALNENRRAAGEPLVYPNLDAEDCP